MRPTNKPIYVYARQNNHILFVLFVYWMSDCVRNWQCVGLRFCCAVKPSSHSTTKRECVFASRLVKKQHTIRMKKTTDYYRVYQFNASISVRMSTWVGCLLCFFLLSFKYYNIKISIDFDVNIVILCCDFVVLNPKFAFVNAVFIIEISKKIKVIDKLTRSRHLLCFVHAVSKWVKDTEYHLIALHSKRMWYLLF